MVYFLFTKFLKFQTKGIAAVLEGLDTVTKVSVNGQIALTSTNMFLEHYVDVRKLLKVGQNTIDIMFQSPVEYANQAAKTFEVRLLYNASRKTSKVYQHCKRFRAAVS